MLNGEPIDDVNEFLYLGSIVYSTGHMEEDIKPRKKKAQLAFSMLHLVLNRGVPRSMTKLWIFNYNVKSALLYVSEQWREMSALMKQVQVFISKCLQQILRIWWPEHYISNRDQWQWTSQELIHVNITRRHCKCNTSRKELSRARSALEWHRQGSWTDPRTPGVLAYRGT